MAVFSLLSILAIPVGDFQATDTLGDLGLELILGLMATTVVVAIVWPGWAILGATSPARWQRSWAFLLVAVLAGIARGLIIHLLGPYLSFTPGTDLVTRLGNSVSTTVVWLVLLSLFANATDEFSRKFHSVMESKVLARSHSTSSEESAGILQGLEDDLRGVAMPPQGDGVTPEDMAALARALREDFLGKVRGASQNLWNFTSEATPALRAGPLLRLSVAKLEYSRGFFLVIFAVLGIPNLASVIGPLEALLRVLIALAVIVLCDAVYRRLLRRVAQEHIALNLFYLLSVGLLSAIPMGFLEFFTSDSLWSFVYIALLTIVIAALPLLESTLNLSERVRDELLAVAAKQSEESDSLLGLDRRVSNTDLASYLHNSLQSEIHSIIFALEGAATNPDKVELGRSSLARLRILTQRSLDEEFRAFASVPLHHLNQVVEGWKGILDISLDWNPPESMAGDSRVPTVVQIIQEVASNAAVHGGATKLDVVVTVEGGAFHVILVSNAPEVAPPVTGQGTSWLQSFAHRLPESKTQVPGQTTLAFKV